MRSLPLVSIAGALALSLLQPSFAPERAEAQSASMSPDARKYLQQFIDLVHNRSIYRNRVDWKQVETRAFAAAEGAQTVADLSPAIKVALTEMGDRLARYRPVAGGMVVPDLQRCPARPVRPPELPKNIGYVRITPIPNTGMRGLNEAATNYQTVIKRGDQEGAEHWIVDLRSYYGPDAVAPLAGLGPLLGEGTVMYIEDINGGQTPYASGVQTMTVGGQNVKIAVDKFVLSHPKPRIAVLVDGGTSGPGEMLAISFVGRKEVRSFGTATCGLSPFTSMPVKLKDGAELVMSGTIIVDRNRRKYPGPFDPDEKVDDADQVIERAVKWLTAVP